MNSHILFAHAAKKIRALPALICQTCDEAFTRKSTRGPDPRRCYLCAPSVRLRQSRQPKKCGDCGALYQRNGHALRCEPCAAEAKSRLKQEANQRRSEGRPGYIPQAVRCANAQKDRSREYTRHYAKRAGLTVEQYLTAKAGKKWATHADAIARREVKKAQTQAKCAIAKAAREVERQERERLKAEAIALHPWRDRSLTEAERWHMRYQLDPEFRIKENLRAQLKKKRMGRTSNWGYCLRRAMVQGKSAPSIETMLGFTIDQLRQHIERQFTKGMDWLRFMAGDIHLDHILPLSSFDMNNDDDVRAAWAITNLRPMWAKENIAKGAKVLTLL